MLANQLKASAAPKNATFFQGLAKTLNWKSFGLGLAATLGVAVGTYFVWQHFFGEKGGRGGNGYIRLRQDAMSADKIKAVLKIYLKESYPILRRAISQVEELKQKLRKENHGHEPHNLNRIVFEKMMEKGKILAFAKKSQEVTLARHKFKH